MRYHEIHFTIVYIFLEHDWDGFYTESGCLFTIVLLCDGNVAILNNLLYYQLACSIFQHDIICLTRVLTISNQSQII